MINKPNRNENVSIDKINVKKELIKNNEEPYQFHRNYEEEDQFNHEHESKPKVND
jgi:hypothetical protein